MDFVNDLTTMRPDFLQDTPVFQQKNAGIALRIMQNDGKSRTISFQRGQSVLY